MANDIKKQRSINDRLTELENNFVKVVMGLNQRFQTVTQRLDLFEENFTGLLNMEGISEALTTFVAQARIDTLRNQAKFEKESLDAGIADGFVYKTETIAEKSILVGRFVLNDVVEEPGRFQAIVPGLGTRFKELLLGKSVGYVMPMDGDRTFVVDEIYEVNEKKYQEVQEAKAKAAADAQAAQKDAASAEAVRAQLESVPEQASADGV